MPGTASIRNTRSCYAFHVFYDTVDAQHACRGEVAGTALRYGSSCRQNAHAPHCGHPGRAHDLVRYFVAPQASARCWTAKLDEREFVARFVMRVKPADRRRICVFLRQKYGRIQGRGLPGGRGGILPSGGIRGLLHGRPTAVTLPIRRAGGAVRIRFAILDYSVVHNGEISSYDANRRFIEMYGYNCSLLTDTEVITYIIDFLVRQQGPDAGGSGRRYRRTVLEHHRTDARSAAGTAGLSARDLRVSLLITGPFSILLGFTGGMMALNDRLKLRSMVVR